MHVHDSSTPSSTLVGASPLQNKKPEIWPHFPIQRSLVAVVSGAEKKSWTDVHKYKERTRPYRMNSILTRPNDVTIIIRLTVQKHDGHAQ